MFYDVHCGHTCDGGFVQRSQVGDGLSLLHLEACCATVQYTRVVQIDATSLDVVSPQHLQPLASSAANIEDGSTRRFRERRLHDGQVRLGTLCDRFATATELVFEIDIERIKSKGRL